MFKITIRIFDNNYIVDKLSKLYLNVEGIIIQCLKSIGQFYMPNKTIVRTLTNNWANIVNISTTLYKFFLGQIATIVLLYIYQV